MSKIVQIDSAKGPETRAQRLARLEGMLFDQIEAQIKSGALKPTALALLAKLIFDKAKECVAPEKTEIRVGYNPIGEEADEEKIA